jgi:hypothetical protein
MCKLIKPPMFHNIEGFEPINSIKDYILIVPAKVRKLFGIEKGLNKKSLLASRLTCEFYITALPKLT